jgi:hypothetical protein
MKHKVTCLRYLCTCKPEQQDPTEENSEIGPELEENNLNVEEDCRD